RAKMGANKDERRPGFSGQTRREIINGAEQSESHRSAEDELALGRRDVGELEELRDVTRGSDGVGQSADQISGESNPREAQRRAAAGREDAAQIDGDDGKMEKEQHRGNNADGGDPGRHRPADQT